MEDFGLFGLFLVCFLASSLYPLGSEAFVVAFLSFDYSLFSIFFVATFGNILGSITTYFIGYLGENYLLEKFFKKAMTKIEPYKIKVSKFGFFYAFLSFLPFVGDLFILALGITKYSFYKTLFFIALGKAFRYAILLFSAQKILQTL